MQLAFLKFHNQVVAQEKVANPGLKGKDLFEHAQSIVRHHYQWVVVHDFLPRVCGRQRVESILAGLRRTGFRPHRAFMPVEFSVAAYRFGHSLVPTKIATNDATTAFDIFSGALGFGFSPVTNSNGVVDWRLFFAFPGEPSPQRATRLDAKLAHALMALQPEVVGDGEASLAVRNLLRAHAFQLPSGEEVAKAMGITPFDVDDLFPGDDAEAAGLRWAFRYGSPLWFYLLREAALMTGGERLGPVGGRLVAETIIGLMEADATSYLGHDTNWQPTLPRAGGRPVGDFDMADLLAFAGA